ncbi:MAG: secondary thiamine-phosphate synthase enzyme YjbQ [Acetobacterales bacterium]
METTTPTDRFAQGSLTLTAPRQGLHEITGDVAGWVSAQGIGSGLLTLFLRHTSASLLIQENWDDDVQHDIETFFARLVPEELSLYTHVSEGADDMPAHIKGALTQTHLAIPVADGAMLLGRYQGIYLFEHRRRTRPRELVLHLQGR